MAFSTRGAGTHACCIVSVALFEHGTNEMNVSHQAFRHQPPIVFSERAVSDDDPPDFRKPGLDYLESLSS